MVFGFAAMIGPWGMWDLGRALILRRWWSGWFRFYCGVGIGLCCSLAAMIWIGVSHPETKLLALGFPVYVVLAFVTMLLYAIWGTYRLKRVHYTLDLPCERMGYQRRLDQARHMLDLLCEEWSHDPRREVIERQSSDQGILTWIIGRRIAFVIECPRDENDETIRLHCLSVLLCNEVGEEEGGSTFTGDNKLVGVAYSSSLHILKEKGISIPREAFEGLPDPDLYDQEETESDEDIKV